MYTNWEDGGHGYCNTLSNMVTACVEEFVEVGLRVYGHQFPNPQECTDTRLEVGFGTNKIDQIQARLKTLKPKGTTPIAESLTKGAYDFPNVILQKYYNFNYRRYRNVRRRSLQCF